MAIETYIAIVACYGVACYLCYRRGYGHGMDFAVRQTITEVSELSDRSTDEIAKLILEHRHRKALKS